MRRGDAPRVRLTAHEEPERWVLGVLDTGDGVDPKQAERIFVPFERANGTGAGLGLAVAQRIVERHGGELWHATPEGGGAFFEFSLPRQD